MKWSASIITSNPEDLKEDNNFKVELVNFHLCSINSLEEHDGSSIRELLSIIGTKDEENIIYVDCLDFISTYIISELIKLDFTPVADLRYHREKSNRVCAKRINKHIYRIKIKTLSYSCEIYDSSKILFNDGYQLAGTEFRPDKYNDHHYAVEESTARARAIKRFILKFLSCGLTDEVTIGAFAIKKLMIKCGGRFQFNSKYPALFQKDEDIVRRAYRGGLTYLKPGLENKQIDNVIDFDVNSLYSYIEYAYRLPYGSLGYTNDFNMFMKAIDGSYGGIMHCQVLAKLKKDHIPCINSRDDFGFGSQILSNLCTPRRNKDGSITYETDIPLDLVLSVPMIDLMYEQYDVEDLGFIEGWYFNMDRSMKGFAEEYYRKKRDCPSGSPDRMVNKGILENVVGKFASRHWAHLEKLSDGFEWQCEPGAELKSFSYIPLAIYVNDLAKCYIVRIGQKHYEQLCYIDTDSLHLIDDGSDLSDIPIGKEIGQFKVEEYFKQVKYFKLKQYIYMDKNGAVKQRISGLVKKIQAKDLTEFKSGGIIENIKSRRALGGKIYCKCRFTLG